LYDIKTLLSLVLPPSSLISQYANISEYKTPPLLPIKEKAKKERAVLVVRAGVQRSRTPALTTSTAY
jgi:hypothetical protein